MFVGIAWIEDYKFAITEEIGPSITIVEALPWEAKVKILREYDLSKIRSDRKKGLEGVAYDPTQRLLYTCQEQDPMKVEPLTSIDSLGQSRWPDLWLSGRQRRRKKVWQVAENGKAKQILNGLTKFAMRDLSGMYFKPKDEGLYILSQQSNVVIKYDFDGKVIDTKAGVEGRQAEGVTFTPDGQLMIIVGEPNYL
eukprot:scaffold298485_cov50-Prasinocladus_malaysianus.AAC.1